MRVLDRLERGADPVAQRAEPVARRRLQRLVRGRRGRGGGADGACISVMPVILHHRRFPSSAPARRYGIEFSTVCRHPKATARRETIHGCGCRIRRVRRRGTQ
ncbi:unnamed protein product [Acidocella sp. C78]|nr:unnamed protein product [Acidocella sp. C78]